MLSVASPQLSKNFSLTVVASCGTHRRDGCAMDTRSNSENFIVHHVQCTACGEDGKSISYGNCNTAHSGRTKRAMIVVSLWSASQQKKKQINEAIRIQSHHLSNTVGTFNQSSFIGSNTDHDNDGILCLCVCLCVMTKSKQTFESGENSREHASAEKLSSPVATMQYADLRHMRNDTITATCGSRHCNVMNRLWLVMPLLRNGECVSWHLLIHKN